MNKFETRKISEKPIRFETAVEMHHYADNGWWRLSVLGFGSDEKKAEASARSNAEKAAAALLVTTIGLSSSRVPETTESAEG